MTIRAPMRRTCSCSPRPTSGHRLVTVPPTPAMNARRRIHPSRSSESRLAPFQLSGSALRASGPSVISQLRRPHRLFLPVRPHVDPSSFGAALAALRSTLERGHLNEVAIGRHVDQCLMSAGVIQTERDQVMYPKLAHVAERLGGRGVTGGWGSLTSWDGLQILSRPGPSRRRGSAEGF